jgi:DNA-binding MarR family transcriptional regulator
MGAESRSAIERRIETLAVDRVLEFLHRSKKDGRLVYPLAEISEATALSPTTVESVLTLLEEEGPYTVRRQGEGSGEIRWLVRGSAYDLDGWAGADRSE